MGEKIIYDRHDEEWFKATNDPARRRTAETWLKQKKSLDRWRHDRMYQVVKPLVEYDRTFQWLTVGDGRYGTDAHALMEFGAVNVVSSDISDTLLKEGHRVGFIKQYSAQNAESLTFNDNSFDFVFCKEAYHHFPRPHIALHEMLRVARIGVILIEPCDLKIQGKILDRFIPFIKKLVRRDSSDGNHNFEPVGNFIFSISTRELEKVQLGMHRRHIAYNYINDYFEEGFEFISLNSGDPKEIYKIKKTKFVIGIRNILTWMGLISPSLLVTTMFKNDPDSSLLKHLSDNNWILKILPKNPYFKPMEGT